MSIRLWWLSAGTAVSAVAVDEVGDDVDGDGEDDGAVLLRRDVVQGLQGPQLEQCEG